MKNMHKNTIFPDFLFFFKKFAKFSYFPFKSSLGVEPRAFRAWQKPLELEPGIEPSLGSFHPYPKPNGKGRQGPIPDSIPTNSSKKNLITFVGVCALKKFVT